MRKYHKILSLCFILLVSGCSLLQDSTASKAWLKPGVQVALPSPMLDVPLKRQQLLTATTANKSDTLVTLLDVDKEQLTLAGLSPLGIRLFKVTYSVQSGIQTEQALVLPELPPANQVLADIMLSYWPLSAWQNLLPKGWSLKDQHDTRLLHDDKGNMVMRISYQVSDNVREPISVEQFAFNYQIKIDNMEETK